MYRILLALLIVVFNQSCFARDTKILDVDFMQSMTDGSNESKKLLTADPKYAHYLQIFQDQYEAKKPSKMAYSQEPLIPKIMHHVWIGGADIPPLYQNYLDECKKLHPDWEFKIWGDKDISDLGLEYQDLYDKSRLYPGKTDIIRFEVVNRFGGVYRDMDIKCLRSIDDLNHQYELYTSLEPASIWNRPAINTGLLAAKANHPMLKKMLERIRLNIDYKLNDFDSGVVSHYTKDIQSLGVDLFMLPFTDIFIENISLTDKSIAFPATYFMPLSYERYGGSRVTKLLDMLPQFYFQSIKPESLMWHNIRKEEIPYTNFDINSLEKKVLNKLSSSEKQKYKIFKEAFNNNSWSRVSKIPQVINFIVFDDNELQQLEKNLPVWRTLNGVFELNAWDKIKISKEFPELVMDDNSSENLRFLIGLKIVEKFGGHYANFKAIPHKSIFELGNKFNFYAGMMPLTKLTKKISLSHKLIGANAHNPILIKTLSQIDLGSNLNKLDEVLTLEVYKNIYLNGKNVVFPAVYFEPIYDCEESFVKRTVRFAEKIPKPFSQVNRYSVVE